MTLLVVGFCVAASLSAILVRWPIFQTRFEVLAGAPQHVHEGDVPRLGGIAVALGVLAALLTLHGRVGFPAWAWALACVAPTLLLGVLEDLRGNVSPAWRYIVCSLSALWVGVSFGVVIPNYDFFLLDAIAANASAALVLSVFCIAGVIQAFNIIDGKNGLASGMAALAIGAMLWLAAERQDAEYVQVALCCLAGVLGFWLVNLLTGRVFLGDSGAYLIGYLVAVLAVVLVLRQPDISPWAPFVVALYPITETLFTMVRRIGFDRVRFSDPDYLHMHSLLYSWLRQRQAGQAARFERYGNSGTALILLLSSSLPLAFALCWPDHSPLLKGVVAAYVSLYCAAYLYLRAQVPNPDSRPS